MKVSKRIRRFKALSDFKRYWNRMGIAPEYARMILTGRYKRTPSSAHGERLRVSTHQQL